MITLGDNIAIDLPPFYVGEDVVAVDAHPQSYFKNGQDYVISAVEYRFGNPHHPVGRVTKYWYVGIVGFANGIATYRPSIFASKTKGVNIMTFEKIAEIEKSCVLIDN